MLMVEIIVSFNQRGCAIHRIYYLITRSSKDWLSQRLIDITKDSASFYLSTPAKKLSLRGLKMADMM